MASVTSLQRILPEKPTLIQSLALKQIRTVKPIHDSSFTELFGELHFKESPQPSPSSSLLPTSSSLDPGSDINQTSVSSTREEGLDFDNSLPQSPSLLESLSFNEIRTARSIGESSITELFGELHFNENPTPSPSSSAPVSSLPSKGLQKPDQKDVFNSRQSTPESTRIICHRSSDSFSSFNSESLHFCTEGLGFESSDDMEDLKVGKDEYCWETQRKSECQEEQFDLRRFYGESRRSRIRGLVYPPPISCIGSNGKPWVLFKSFRDNGRFVLKEIRIPTREFLHAYREDGRLKLHFVLPDDEFLEEQNEEEEDDDDVESIVVEEKDDSV